MYDDGRGVPRDYAEAVRWYRMAAEQGNARAQFSLGSMYDHGEGLPRTTPRLFAGTASGGTGNADAQNSLGLGYEDGQGAPQDHAEAARWYRKAAEQGNAGAQFNLALSYEQGQGCRRTT